MRNLVFTTLIFLIICQPVRPQEEFGLYEFERFWELRNRSFRDKSVSPLLAADFERFEGLKYFAFEENYRIKANLLKTDDARSFLMPTSVGGSRKYLKIGDLSFKLNGREFTLVAYISENTGEPRSRAQFPDLFVPFRDLTNGGETYSAGRYVYMRYPKDGEPAVLDFNIAFNPNCAYNSGFVCTLPPKENSLQVEIKAGEKSFVSVSEKSKP